MHIILICASGILVSNCMYHQKEHGDHRVFFTTQMKVFLAALIVFLWYCVFPDLMAGVFSFVTMCILIVEIVSSRASRKQYNPNVARTTHSKSEPILRKRPDGFTPNKRTVHVEHGYVDRSLVSKSMLRQSMRPAIVSRARHDLEKLERIPPHRLLGASRKVSKIADIPLHLSLTERLEILEQIKKYGDPYTSESSNPIDRLRVV